MYVSTKTNSVLPENEDKNTLIEWIIQNSEKLVFCYPKLFWPSARKICSGDREKLLKFTAEFTKWLRAQDQFIRTVKCQNNFLTCSWKFLRSKSLKQLKLEKTIDKRKSYKRMWLKPGQNKVHCFLNLFLQVAAEKKD